MREDSRQAPIVTAAGGPTLRVFLPSLLPPTLSIHLFDAFSAKQYCFTVVSRALQFYFNDYAFVLSFVFFRMFTRALHTSVYIFNNFESAYSYNNSILVDNLLLKIVIY